MAPRSRRQPAVDRALCTRTVSGRAAIEAILWDFGDTLTDERWMLEPLPGSPAWADLYLRRCGAGELGSLWNRGLKTSREVAFELADELGVQADVTLEHMRACCRRVRLFPRVEAFAAACKAPQAIVTVNCDLFSEVVAPALALDARFRPIVTSWEEGTEDKADLCDAAMARLGLADRGSCLLVDNRAENVAAWRSRGGAAHHFLGEHAFCDWAARSLRSLLGDVPLR